MAISPMLSPAPDAARSPVRAVAVLTRRRGQTSRRGHPLNPLARDAEVAGDLPRAAIAPTSADMIALREPTTQTTRVRRVCVAYPKQGIAGRPPALPSSRSSVDVSSFAARVHQYASG
jgi:hypothetical protein